MICNWTEPRVEPGSVARNQVSFDRFEMFALTRHLLSVRETAPPPSDESGSTWAELQLPPVMRRPLGSASAEPKAQVCVAACVLRELPCVFGLIRTGPVSPAAGLSLCEAGAVLLRTQTNAQTEPVQTQQTTSNRKRHTRPRPLGRASAPKQKCFLGSTDKQQRLRSVSSRNRPTKPERHTSWSLWFPVPLRRKQARNHRIFIIRELWA